MQVYLQITVFTVCLQELRWFAVTNVQSWKELFVFMVKKANEEKVSSCLETEQKHNLVWSHPIHSINTKNVEFLFYIILFSIHSSNVFKE